MKQMKMAEGSEQSMFRSLTTLSVVDSPLSVILSTVTEVIRNEEYHNNNGRWGINGVVIRFWNTMHYLREFWQAD